MIPSSPLDVLVVLASVLLLGVLCGVGISIIVRVSIRSYFEEKRLHYQKMVDQGIQYITAERADTSTNQ